MESSIYTEAKEAGLVVGNHYSDLYLKSTPEAWSIIRKHGCTTATSFKSNINGEMCIDVPFAYDPYWDSKGVKCM